jgi:hypothetical protein
MSLKMWHHWQTKYYVVICPDQASVVHVSVQEPCQQQFMEQIVNRGIQDYLSIVDEYYSQEAFPNDERLTREMVISLLSDRLRSAWHDTDIAADRWRNLVLNVKGKPWVKFARDWEKATPQAYKMIVGIEPDNNDIPSSIVVFLSFVGKQIGMLYVDMLAAGSNDRPFYEHSRTPGNYSPVSFASYSPLNKLQEKYSIEILEEISKLFPEFTLFENRFADDKVQGVQTEEDYYSDIDLFMVFFERGLPAGVPT